MRRQTIPFIFTLGLLLQACGQTGPLYLPDQAPPIYVPDVPEEEDDEEED